MSAVTISSQYAWLFLGALHWRMTLVIKAAFALAGALLSRHRARVLCFGMALLLSADVLLLFLLPRQE